MTDGACCEFCAFWDASEKNPTEGTCHRYPPTTVMKTDGALDVVGSVWAYTPGDAWCGEFRGKH